MGKIDHSLLIIPGLPDELARECLARLSHTQFALARSVSKLWKAELESPSFHQFRKLIGSSRPVLALAQADPSQPSVSPLKHTAPLIYRLKLFDPLSGSGSGSGSGSWTPLPPIPSRTNGLPLFCQLAAVGTQLVLLGGWDPATWNVLDDVHVYDFTSATWRVGARMPGPRRSFFACASDGDSKVYVAGGHDDDKNAFKSAMAYDVAKDEWVLLADMARERDECKGAFLRGGFHVIGGYETDGQGRFDTSAEVFHADTCQWGPVEDVLEIATCPRTCTAGQRGELYRCRAGELVVRDGDTWQVVCKLPRDAVVGPFLMTWQGKVIVIGAEKHGGPYRMHVLESMADKPPTWLALDVPKEHVGHVQAACCLEL